MKTMKAMRKTTTHKKLYLSNSPKLKGTSSVNLVLFVFHMVFHTLFINFWQNHENHEHFQKKQQDKNNNSYKTYKSSKE